jgi:hypothetical protein
MVDVCCRCPGYSSAQAPQPSDRIGVQARDLVIQRATESTQKARVQMVRKYSKKHDIQHFDIGAIVSLKVPREDRTSTDNKAALCAYIR